jgi:hypothetical protein
MNERKTPRSRSLWKASWLVDKEGRKKEKDLATSWIYVAMLQLPLLAVKWLAWGGSHKFFLRSLKSRRGCGLVG